MTAEIAMLSGCILIAVAVGYSRGYREGERRGWSRGWLTALQRRKKICLNHRASATQVADAEASAVQAANVS